MKIIAWLKKKENFIPIIIFILAVLAFVFNFRNFFLSDDWDFLAQVAGSHQPLWRYFFTNYTGTHAGGSYRPLVVYFWVGAYHFFGLNYFWYHLLQVFLHAGNALLLYFIVLNFFWPANKEDRFIWAVVSSAIFIILPNHSEAVAWLAAVCDPLCAFFYLASLLLLLLCLEYPSKKYWLYGGSLLFFLAAIFTKEMAMSLPFIVLIFAGCYIWQKKEKNSKIFFVLPYFILLAGYFWLRYRAIGLFFGYYGQTHLQLGWTKIAAVYSDLTTSFVLSDNWRTIFSLWLNSNLAFAAIILILLLAGAAHLTWKRKWPLWPWLIFFSLGISLVPVASFGINLTQTYFSEEGERYGYLPSLFFAVLLAALLVAVAKKIWHRFSWRIIFVVLMIFLVAALALQLTVKNWRYDQAAKVAKQALMSAVTAMKQSNYAGVLFFGLPDNFHGAPIFRNGWQEAIAFYLPQPPTILAPFSRTAFEDKQSFAVENVDQNDFNYYSRDAAKLILAKPEFSSADYSTVLNNFTFEPGGINDRYFGSRLAISLSPNLSANSRVALFFWSGTEWTIFDHK